MAVQLPQEWENIKLVILYFCLKKKYLISIHFFLANSSYITIPYFKPMKKWTLAMCPEWKESEDLCTAQMTTTMVKPIINHVPNIY